MRSHCFVHVLGALILMANGFGCAHRGDSAPVSLRGQNTQFRIDFDHAPSASQAAQSQPARGLADDELCFIEVGDATIECFRVGSLLVLAPDDGELLVADNPIDDLRAAGAGAPSIEALQALGAVGVIGASIERLPETLADYLSSDGDNPDVARSAATLLLQHKETPLVAHGHGGPFTITVRLTPAGRKVLTDALHPSVAPGALLVGATHPGTIRRN